MANSKACKMSKIVINCFLFCNLREFLCYATAKIPKDLRQLLEIRRCLLQHDYNMKQIARNAKLEVGGWNVQ